MRRVAGGLTLALVVLWAAVPAASARVVLETVAPRGDGSVDLVLTVDRGCAGGATVALAVTLPARAAVISAQDPTGWEHRIDDHLVRWTGGPLAAGDAARFTVTARLDARPGQVVVLPSVQECADGTTVEWTGAPDTDQRPAPRLVATTATVDPSLRPVLPPVESAGAGPAAVGLAVAVFTGLALVLGVGVGRVRRRG